MRQGGQNGTGRANTNFDRGDIRCFECHDLGHIARECSQRRAILEREGRPPWGGQGSPPQDTRLDPRGRQREGPSPRGEQGAPPREYQNRPPQNRYPPGERWRKLPHLERMRRGHHLPSGAQREAYGTAGQHSPGIHHPGESRKDTDGLRRHCQLHRNEAPQPPERILPTLPFKEEALTVSCADGGIYGAEGTTVPPISKGGKPGK